MQRNGDDYDMDINMMWCRLGTKYGTKQKLIDCIISDIKRLPENNDSAQSQPEIICTIEAASNDLKFIEPAEELNNSTVLFMVEQHMSNKMHNLDKTHCQNTDEVF